MGEGWWVLQVQPWYTLNPLSNTYILQHWSNVTNRSRGSRKCQWQGDFHDVPVNIHYAQPAWGFLLSPAHPAHAAPICMQMIRSPAASLWNPLLGIFPTIVNHDCASVGWSIEHSCGTNEPRKVTGGSVLTNLLMENIQGTIMDATDSVSNSITCVAVATKPPPNTPSILDTAQQWQTKKTPVCLKKHYAKGEKPNTLSVYSV